MQLSAAGLRVLVHASTRCANGLVVCNSCCPQLSCNIHTTLWVAQLLTWCVKATTSSPHAELAPHGCARWLLLRLPVCCCSGKGHAASPTRCSCLCVGTARHPPRAGQQTRPLLPHQLQEARRPPRPTCCCCCWLGAPEGCCPPEGCPTDTTSSDPALAACCRG